MQRGLKHAKPFLEAKRTAGRRHQPPLLVGPKQVRFGVLEREPSGHLQQPGRVQIGDDIAELRISDNAVGTAELHPVEEVECFDRNSKVRRSWIGVSL